MPGVGELSSLRLEWTQVLKFISLERVWRQGPIQQDFIYSRYIMEGGYVGKTSFGPLIFCQLAPKRGNPKADLEAFTALPGQKKPVVCLDGLCHSGA